jgi:hypothetical protein
MGWQPVAICQGGQDLKEKNGRRRDVRVIGTTIQEGTRLRKGSDKVPGTQDPADTPSRETPILGEDLECILYGTERLIKPLLNRRR